MIKILNLYVGIGGNRRLWPDDEIEVTAVELNPQIAKIYQDFFPNDKVIVANAHDYLLKNFQKFDFIWSSPPCPSHSRMRMLWSSDGKNIKGKISGSSFKFPDMKLYEEIIFLKHFFKGKFVVENVVSYYDPLIKPFISENHYFWSNFHINNRPKMKRDIITGTRITLKKWGFDLTDLDLPLRFRNKILNNLVNPKLGRFIFDSAFKEQQTQLSKIV